jgi:hypothetical protein
MNDPRTSEQHAPEDDREEGSEAVTDPEETVTDPEDRGAPVAESHYVVSEHDGKTRIDIADDATARPGPGPGQPEADPEP